MSIGYPESTTQIVQPIVYLVVYCTLVVENVPKMPPLFYNI